MIPLFFPSTVHVQNPMNFLVGFISKFLLSKGIHFVIHFWLFELSLWCTNNFGNSHLGCIILQESKIKNCRRLWSRTCCWQNHCVIHESRNWNSWTWVLTNAPLLRMLQITSQNSIQRTLNLKHTMQNFFI